MLYFAGTGQVNTPPNALVSLHLAYSISCALHGIDTVKELANHQFLPGAQQFFVNRGV